MLRIVTTFTQIVATRALRGVLNPRQALSNATKTGW